MAKWGQGDPRWIVEERPDATNVNNWHWTEKNASSWSKDKLKDLLVDFTIKDDEVGECTIYEMEKCDGDAVANNRKAKLIFFYEWDIKLKWKGKAAGSSDEVEGKIHIPNLSEENDSSEVDVSVTVEKSSKNAQKLKDFLRTKGADQVRAQLDSYVQALKKEFARDMILPKKGQDDSMKTRVVDKTPNLQLKQPYVNSSTNEQPTGCKIKTASINLKHTFKCRAEEFYNALTVPEMVQAFTRGAAKVDAKAGGRFELFEGNVQGTFEKLQPPRQIVQQWRFRSWPQGHYSKVTIDIHQTEDSTEVTVTQTGVPYNEVEHTTEGWEKYYWQSIKRTFGFGAFIL